MYSIMLWVSDEDAKAVKLRFKKKIDFEKAWTSLIESEDVEAVACYENGKFIGARDGRGG